MATIAAVQRGRVSRGQLLPAGISGATIGRLTRSGYLWPEHPGVYAVGHPTEVPGGREAAALLSVRAGAALSHLTAERWWGLASPPRGRDTDAVDSAVTIHLTLPGNRARGPSGVTVHRSTILVPSDLRVRDGLPVTSAARTLLDRAAVLATRELERALDTGLVERIVTLREIRVLLGRCGRHPGRAALTALLDAHQTSTFTRSEAEERFLALLRDAGLPQPLVNVRRHGFEIDFLWPQAGYAVEIDGRAFHSTPYRISRDARRDRILRDAGIDVERFSWQEITTTPLAVVAKVAARLAATPAPR